MSRYALSIALLTLIIPTSVLAGDQWQTASTVRVGNTPRVVYGTLPQEGQANFFRLAVSRPETLLIGLGVPNSEPTFSPRFVVYQPDTMTIGPLLPMTPPPNTLALVYPAIDHTPTFDAFTQASYQRVMETAVQFPAAGQYYLAVYNASPAPGRFRLAINDANADLASLSDSWTLPVAWWRDQAFAGWSWRTLLTPLLFVVVSILIIEQLRFYKLHHLAPSQRPVKKKKTNVTRKR